MRLLLVTPSRSYRVGAFLDAARTLGCEVTVATDAASAVPGSSVCVSFDDPVHAAERMVELVGTVDGVVGTDGAAVAVAAEAARMMGFPTNPSESLRAAGNKHLQRRAAGAAGVSQPDFALIDDANECLWSSFPAVVKPLDRSGSQGVVRVNSRVELQAGVHAIGEIVGLRSPLLVEEFVPGVEVAIEGLLNGGRLDVLAVFDKPDTPQGPTFPETLLVSPARLDPDTMRRVMEVVEGAVVSIGLVEGPVHVECKVDGTDVWFLELAARTIGGLCSRALANGRLSLEEVVIRHALGLPLPSSSCMTATGVLMLPANGTGRLEAVRGVDAARAVEGVTDVVVCVGVGQDVVALPAGDRYLGFVFARAQTADDVEVALRRAWETLEIEITAS